MLYDRLRGCPALVINRTGYGRGLPPPW